MKIDFLDNKKAYNMSVSYTILDSSNSDNNIIKLTDPHDHLEPREWVDVQIDWCTNNICGTSLIPALLNLGGDLIGCEIGVCLGTTSDAFLKRVPNIKKYYAVDHYPVFIDGNVANLSKERQELIKQYAFDILSKHDNKVNFEYVDSDTFSKTIPDEHLDFIFIDGDHRYESVLRDLNNYYSKIKIGGIFAGHDYGNREVNAALRDFLKEDYDKIHSLENDVWYVEKK